LFESISNKIKQLEKKVENGLDSTSDPSIFSFQGFLLVCSWFYGLVVKFRLVLYKNKILKSEKLPCLVISVGNMVVGGAGKTPMAVYLAEQLKKMGKKPVVISRGYKGKYYGAAMIVSDGNKIFCNAQVCGDEPFMMAKKKSFPVVVGKNRVIAGKLAIDKLGCDTIILDDGFQHLKLERDLNLLLLDWEHPLGNKRFLPSGRLRETAKMAIPRADAILFTRSHQSCEILEKPIQMITDATPKADVCFFSHHVPFIVQTILVNRSKDKRFTDLASLKNKKALLFSGIAKNQAFYQTAEKMGVNIVSHLEFKDHYRYKGADIEKINKRAMIKEVDLILTTEKDWAKLGSMDSEFEWQTDLVILGINIDFQPPEMFLNFLKKSLK